MGKAVIAIHGGAGAISRAQMSLQQELRYIEALSAIVETGQKMLVAGEWTAFCFQCAGCGDGSGASAGRVSTV
ncbi:hypothetical protein EIMP300_67580 [Escherichia coli]|uniref:Beta-aspartyl-peptidase n=1 Tax=Escherichia coli TaxID=562 RepID=A0A8S0G069_ECOLX|nr:hypothetical protein EIMP300_67580 [Escherichia coli]